MHSEDDRRQYHDTREAEELACERLPSRMRLLCVSREKPSWINLTLHLEREGCQEPRFVWESNSGHVLAILREESFDCVLIFERDPETDITSERPSLHLIRGMRAIGHKEPVILITTELDESGWIDACRQDCEVLTVRKGYESSALAAMIRRTIRRMEQARESHRLRVAEDRRLARERDEAEHLLKQQRAILTKLSKETLATNFSENEEQNSAISMRLEKHKSYRKRLYLPEKIDEYYQKLLRTYVIMGTGNLSEEIARLAEQISLASMSPRETLELHLKRVEALVRGLGNRSARHVMARADLLALELMTHLGECYQKKLLDRNGSPRRLQIDSNQFEPRKNRSA